MANWKIQSEEKTQSEDLRYLIDKLKEFNDAHTPTLFRRRDIRLFVRDDDGQIQGGLLGTVNMHCLVIQILWIEDSLRRQGVGRELMQVAEGIAREEGARQAVVETTTFQAQGFYEKLGYVQICEIKDSPIGASSLLMQKAL
jgi:GNAT superfamily N-acetyltransferase